MSLFFFLIINLKAVWFIMIARVVIDFSSFQLSHVHSSFADVVVWDQRRTKTKFTMYSKSQRLSLSSWHTVNSVWKTFPYWKTPQVSPTWLNLRSRKTEMLNLLKYETEKMEKLKAPLRDCSFIIQIPQQAKKERAGKCHKFWSDVIKVHYTPQ